jgi:hypothetical protein|tara:strand:+ start:120 stop:371 length:252 start_codon:yes stop_codon:yes gene_type:complete
MELEMKALIILSLLFCTSISYAKIQQPSEESIAKDLGFGLTSEKSSTRSIASDKKSDKTKDDQKRDVASEPEQSQPKVEYWSY